MAIIDFKAKKQEFSEEIFQKELDKAELYNSTYHDLVMNVSKKLNPAQHKCIMLAITPALAHKFHSQDKEKSKQLISQYIKIKPEDKSFLDQMPDNPSIVSHIFQYYMKSFQQDVAVLTHAELFDKNQDFYFEGERLFNLLPVSYVFSVIDLYESVKDLK